MNRTDLHSGWTVHPTAGPVPNGFPSETPARVPGCVHTDFLSAGLIPDPYLDTNEAEVQWIGRSDFAYRTTFSYQPDGSDRVELVCDGLDTVAVIVLNGVEIGKTQNQHRAYRFDVGGHLLVGDNDLEVRFTSALNWAESAQERIGVRPFVGNALPYNAIRKMAANFGWDWGPVLITAGIWKPIHLDSWSTARLDGVVAVPDLDSDGVGIVRINAGIAHAMPNSSTVQATLRDPRGAIVARGEVGSAAESDVSLELRVDHPELWWPRGHGEQPLYALEVELITSSPRSDDGKLLDSWSHETGIRAVQVDAHEDVYGTGFTVYINGTRIFVKGANWIPNDCFPSRITRADYADGVRDAVEADMNLLRVWGGGIFESDDFYAEANRAGILVWQDFLFACAAYSEAPELWDEVEAEARQNVARLAPNPSLVIYNGSNENVEGYYEWGWKDALGPDATWGNGYYENLLPGIVAEIDGTRPYFPSSPFSPTDATNPRDPDNGTVHSWEVWNRQDYTTYRDVIPRFVSEFGFQGPPNAATIARVIHDRPLRPTSPGMLAHQKADDGNGKLERGFAPHLPEPTSFEDWHFTTQLNQAHAITYGISHFRSYSPRNGGSIIWQLNDCWPVTSWAAVDGDRRRKPLWYALRTLNAPRWATVQPRDGGLSLIASNDSSEPWNEAVVARRVRFDGSEASAQSIELVVPAGETVTYRLEDEIRLPDEPESELVIVDFRTAPRAFWYFVEDRDLELAAADVAVSAERVDGGYRVEIRANELIKDIVLNVDRISPDAVADDALVTLLPGEKHVFAVRTTKSGVDAESFEQRPVFQCVNNLLYPVAGSSDALEEELADAIDN